MIKVNKFREVSIPYLNNMNYLTHFSFMAQDQAAYMLKNVDPE